MNLDELLGHEGSLTSGLIIGSFFCFESSSFLLFSSLSSLSKLNAMVDPPNNVDLEFPSCSFVLNKLPQLILLEAAGEQFKNFICSESNPSKFGLIPECRRSLSLSYSRGDKLGEWLECRRKSFIRWVRSSSVTCGDGGSTTTLNSGICLSSSSW